MRKLKRLRIGIVGCGAIGSSLAAAIVKNFSGQSVLAGIFDTQKEKSLKLARRLNMRSVPVRDLAALVRSSDLVIEATHMLFAYDIASRVIAQGKDVMIMSAGGILGRYEELRAKAAKRGVKIYVPSGAIAGIDAVKAAGMGKIKKVSLTTIKSPQSFAGVAYVQKKKIKLDRITADTVLFEGNAIQATRCFPQNINVAATLSMAGVGPRKTKVRIVASPKATRNIHQIEIESASGTVVTRVENVLHPHNPKTSYLAVLSAVAALKQILEPLQIGT